MFEDLKSILYVFIGVVSGLIVTVISNKISKKLNTIKQIEMKKVLIYYGLAIIIGLITPILFIGLFQFMSLIILGVEYSKDVLAFAAGLITIVSTFTSVMIFNDNQKEWIK